MEGSTKKRIFHIAKELNISHIEIMKFLKSNNVDISSHMALVDSKTYEMIIGEFAKEKITIDRQRKEQARKKLVADRKTSDSNTAPLDSEPSKKITLESKDSIVGKLDSLKSSMQKKSADSISEKNAVKTDIAKPEISLKTIRIDRPEKVKTEPVSPQKSKRKLKKIDISEIVHNLNQNKRPKTGDSKTGIKTSLSQLTTKPSKKKVKKKVKTDIVVNEDDKNIIKIAEFSTVDELASSMSVSPQDVIKVCMGLGLMVTINQRLDNDTMLMVADEFDFEIETSVEFAEEITRIQFTDDELAAAGSRAPVVTIMGHVDHGKTSLLDYIRDTNVVAGESGSITQHIGAYEVSLDNGKKITFLDTPGHAAFTAMRARGAQITDIVVIIVAADDDVMPQTLEAIDHAKAAGVPIVVAINKIDKPASDPDKVKKSLSEKGLLVEEWGGKIQSASISAKTGEGISDLLDKILLEADVLELKSVSDCMAQGTIIESRVDKGFGPIATVLVQKGTLSSGDVFLCGDQYFKVRALLDERSHKIEKALPSDPVQVLGFSQTANAGEIFTVMKDEREAKKITIHRSQLKREAEQRRFKKITLDQIGKQIASGQVKELNIILKGDVDGSIEALSDSLMKLSNDEVTVNILHKSIGIINENDVTLASASNAIVVAFNVSIDADAKGVAKNLGVDIRSYTIIYEAINEIKLALEGLLEPDIVESALGFAEVRAQFKIPKLGVIAGCFITKGKVVRNSLLRVRRDDETLHEGKLTSLKRFKDDAKEVLEGFECGIGVDGFYDFIEGDIIEVYELQEVKRVLS